MGDLGDEFKIQAMYVDVLSEGFRTRVRFPPPPPDFASDFKTKSEATSRQAMNDRSLLNLHKSEGG